MTGLPMHAGPATQIVVAQEAEPNAAMEWSVPSWKPAMTATPMHAGPATQIVVAQEAHPHAAMEPYAQS